MINQQTVRLTTSRVGELARRSARRRAPVVAVDIGADAIVALEVGGDGGRVRHAIVRPLPTGLVVDGEVVDADGLAAELRALFGEHRLPRDVRVGLAHPRLMVRLVELPATLTGRDLDGAVHHLAAEQLPVGLDQLVVDYRRVGSSPDGDPSQQRLLMAAARIDGIDRLVDALDGAGLRLKRIALSGLAMVAALDRRTLPGEATLYVQAGALTNVVVAEDGHPLLVRAASAGSESIAAGLAERLEIGHEEARAHVASLGLGAMPVIGSTAPVSDELRDAVSQQVREGMRRVVAEVQSSRGVYAARPDARPIGAVVLTGSMTTWPGVAEALELELDLPVLMAGRESWPSLSDVAIAPERLDVVIGLTRDGGGMRPDLRPPSTARDRESAPLTAAARGACAMLALLAATIVYLVAISNQVSSDRERLGTLTTQLAAAERQAAALKPYDDFARATATRRDAITTVASTRFNWDRALVELADVSPGGVWLTSAKGTLTPTVAVDGGTTDGTTGGLRGALSAPALELAGCALREGLVPSYIDALHGLTGVTDVGFSRSERLDKPTARQVGSGGGDCRNGDAKTARFGLVAYFKNSPARATTAAATPVAPATPAPAAPATPAAAAAGPPAGSIASPNYNAATSNGGSR